MKQFSLRNKIFLSFGCIILLVMSVSTFVHIHELKKDYLEALEWRSEALAQLIFRDIKLIRKYTPNAIKNPPRFYEKLSRSCKQLFEIKKESNIAHCAVINPGGLITAHNLSKFINQPVSPVIRPHIQADTIETVLDNKNYHFLIPIIEKINNQKIFLGMIDIGIPEEIVATKIDRLINSSLQLLALFLLITFICISLILYALIGEPLSKLMYVAGEIMKGNYHARAQLKTHDEIGQTGRAFDTMTTTLVDIIQQRDKNIEDINLLTRELEEQNRKLAEERTLLRTLIDHIPDYIYVKDREHRFLLVNDALLRSAEVTKMEEFIGKSDYDLLAKEIADQYLNDEKYIFDSGQPLINREELIKNRVTGENTWLLTTKVPLLDNKNNIIGLVGINKDITNQKKTEEELIKHRTHLEDLVNKRTDELRIAKEAAEKANLAKSEFLARMSHEIRTPLSAVIGLNNVVLKTKLTNDQRDYLTKAQIASNNLLEVINDILDFSKVEADRLELTHAPFNLHQLLDKQAGLFSNRVSQKNLELVFAVDPDVPQQLMGDAPRLSQVLTNLLANAIKFTDKGKIGVQVDPEGPTGSDDRTNIKFQVSDTGIGIPADVLPSLFEPFTQADSSLSRKHEGTGLGLAICKRLVELMGGRIWAESTPDRGSTFSFTTIVEVLKEDKPRLPVREKDTPELGRPPVESQAGGQLQGRRVMVVEDSVLNRDVAIALLEEMGLKVDTAENGQIARDKIIGTDGYYDAVLMDIQMPVMDGYTATREIRSWEADREQASQKRKKTQDPDIGYIRDPSLFLPIIALTAHALKGEREKCLIAGMNDYIAKPIDELELQRVLIKWVGIKQEY